MDRQITSNKMDFASGLNALRKVLLASGAALLLSSCTQDQKPGDLTLRTTSDAVQLEAEAVGTISFDGTAVTASVISTGCTLQEHFVVEHEVRDDACLITLVRTNADFCRRAPFMMEVSVPWEAPAECADLTVEFANPIIDMDKKTTKDTPGRQLPKQ